MPKYFFNNFVLLKNFDKSRLRTTVHDCVDRNVYNIDYSKNAVSSASPLHLVIPKFCGHVEENNGRKFLIITQIENNLDVLKYHKEVWDKILEHINKINNSEYFFKEDYPKFKLGSIKCSDAENEFNEIPVGELLKFSFEIVSSRLVIEKIMNYF